MITVKLFGTLRVDTGVKEVLVQGDRVKDLYNPVLKEILRINPLCEITLKKLKSCNAAVNGTLSAPGTKLRDGDIVYLFPAVAGG